MEKLLFVKKMNGMMSRNGMIYLSTGRCWDHSPGIRKENSSGTGLFFTFYLSAPEDNRQKPDSILQV